jgi:hypothetical protein
MHWILQNNIYNEAGFAELVGALERLGLPFSLHKVIPFVGELDPEPAPHGDRVVVMGSYTLARAAQRRGWQPGAWLDNLDFSIQREHWGAAILNHDAEVVPLGEIPEQREPFFLRPVTDTKSFAGRVLDWPSFLEWHERLRALSPEDRPEVWLDTPVMVCRNKEIWSEARLWIVDGRVATASGYKVGTLVRSSPPELVDPRVLDFAAARAAEWSPNRAYVMDLAETPDGLKIIEVNNLNSAGWYKADLNQLVIALEAMP